MLSGEPLPVDKKTGDTVVGGTINGEWLLKFRATRVGQDTPLAQIVWPRAVQIRGPRSAGSQRIAMKAVQR